MTGNITFLDQLNYYTATEAGADLKASETIFECLLGDADPDADKELLFGDVMFLNSMINRFLQECGMDYSDLEDKHIAIKLESGGRENLIMEIEGMKVRIGKE